MRKRRDRRKEDDVNTVVDGLAEREKAERDVELRMDRKPKTQAGNRYC